MFGLESLEARTLLAAYEVRLLGCLGEGVVVSDMNNSGQVVGTMRGQAFMWSPSKGITFLGTLGGQQSAATVINDRGEIAGWSHTATGAAHLFRYTNGSMHDAGAFAPGTQLHVNDINEAGEVIGTAVGNDTTYHAFLHDGKRFVELGRGSAHFISDDGVGFGYASAEDVRDPRFVTAESLARPDLRFIGMADNGTFIATGYDWPLQVFGVRDGVVVHDYGDLGQPRLSFRDINAGGTVVGQAADVHRRNRGAFASVEGKLAFLDDLIPPGSGWRLKEAVAVNDAGYIIGHGDYGTRGYGNPFLLIPASANVPDPCAQLPTATLEDGVLRVIGTDGPDEIEVRRVDGGGMASDGPDEEAYYRVEYLRTPKGRRPSERDILGSVTFRLDLVRRVEVHGGKGDDRISVSPSTKGEGRLGMVRRPSVLMGGDGNDHLRGGLSRDTLWGGRGDDLLVGVSGADELRGQRGNDTLLGNDGDDRLIGGAGDDSLSGGPGLDELLGGGGRNWMAGDRDTDLILGTGDGIVATIFGRPMDRTKTGGWNVLR